MSYRVRTPDDMLHSALTALSSAESALEDLRRVSGNSPALSAALEHLGRSAAEVHSMAARLSRGEGSPRRDPIWEFT